jgi:hypothetical protein
MTYAEAARCLEATPFLPAQYEAVYFDMAAACTRLMGDDSFEIPSPSSP